MSCLELPGTSHPVERTLGVMPNAKPVKNAPYKLPNDVGMRLHPPIQYTMQYLDGAVTYKEPFVLMKVGKNSAAAGLAAYDAIFAAIAGACYPIPYVGPALTFLVEAGAHWFKHVNLDPDGGITFAASYHYVGTLSAGIDLTAWPLPGIPPDTWSFCVNNLIAGVRVLAPSRPVAPGAPSKGKTPGKPTRRNAVSAGSAASLFDFSAVTDTTVGTTVALPRTLKLSGEMPKSRAASSR